MPPLLPRRTFLHCLGSLSLYSCGSDSATVIDSEFDPTIDAGAVNGGDQQPPDEFVESCLNATPQQFPPPVAFDEQEGRVFGLAQGTGLNGRLYTDLSRLSPNALITATEQFYIRTRYPNTLDRNGNGSLDEWTIRLEGAVRQQRIVTMQEMLTLSEDQGVHLMECSGNFRAGGFGLMSSAHFDGVALTSLLQQVEALPEASLLEVVGRDEHEGASPNGRSTPGASWILTPDQFRQTGAFLATHMNGEPLPLDHGFPVRLLNPGWYGCSCIKWVTALRWLSNDAAASSQMKEFAARTHQQGTPALARDYAAPDIQVAAMPIRVEQWQDEQGIFYQVVGIVWGGRTGSDLRPVNSLELSFDGGKTFTPIECGSPGSPRTWRLWSTQWQPPNPGQYDLVCRVPEPNVPTRRLDSQYYRRRVTVAEV